MPPTRYAQHFVRCLPTSPPDFDALFVPTLATPSFPPLQYLFISRSHAKWPWRIVGDTSGKVIDPGQCVSDSCCRLSAFMYQWSVDLELLSVAKISATELLLSAWRAYSIFSFFSSNHRGLKRSSGEPISLRLDLLSRLQRSTTYSGGPCSKQQPEIPV